MDKMAPRADNIALYLGQFAPVQISDEPAGRLRPTSSCAVIWLW